VHHVSSLARSSRNVFRKTTQIIANGALGDKQNKADVLARHRGQAAASTSLCMTPLAFPMSAVASAQWRRGFISLPVTVAAGHR